LASGELRAGGRLAAVLGALTLLIGGCSAGGAVSSSDVATLRDWASQQGIYPSAKFAR
jgi:hypothetical protein